MTESEVAYTPGSKQVYCIAVVSEKQFRVIILRYFHGAVEKVERGTHMLK